MKKQDGKSPAQLAEERAEAAELAATILRLTERIPHHVINHPGVMYARKFKEEMVKARTVASSPVKNLAKLRSAMNDVNFYYRSQA